MVPLMSLSKALRHLAQAVPSQTTSGLLMEIADKVARMEGGWQADVRAFQRKFGFGTPSGPCRMNDRTLELRYKLVDEECEELLEAIEENDPVKIAQECVDVIYVAFGTAIEAGVDLTPIWAAIHEANMQKQVNPNGGKTIKPLGWVKPDVAALVEKQR